jgi:hypothetical protein
VIASRERRVLSTPSRSRLSVAWESWKFRVNEWMRPLTIPATGGIVSSLLLSAVFALSMVTASTRSVAYDVPVDYQDPAQAFSTPNLVPMSLQSALLLNMSLDGHGHIQDYLVRDASAQITGNGNELSSHDISLPSFPAPAVGGDISILVTPVVYLR